MKSGKSLIGENIFVVEYPKPINHIHYKKINRIAKSHHSLFSGHTNFKFKYKFGQGNIVVSLGFKVFVGGRL